MNDRLLPLRIFARVARLGSFSRAGRELGLSQPSVSRAIAALESELGTTLFARSTRAVTLSEAGVDYLAGIEPALAMLDEAGQAVRRTGELTGRMRIAMSTSFGVREIIPLLPTFMAKHPTLAIDLLMSDQRHDLIAEGVDLAFRLGTLSDSALVARKLSQAPRILVASPDYLAKAGTPDHPAALGEHAIILGPGGSAAAAWIFEKEGRRVSIKLDGRLKLSANEGVVASAMAGLGIASTSLWGCRTELAGGSLVQILTDWHMPAIAVHAIYPSGRGTPAARAFVDHVADALAHA